MKVLVYWHDMFLPHSYYILKAFDQSPLISELLLLGPETVNEEAIFNQSDGQKEELLSAKTQTKTVKTYGFMPKCCTYREYVHHIQSFQPDLVLVLDEPLSLNVLLAGMACRKAHCKAKVMFYGFENIYSGIPIRYFLDRPNLSRFTEMLKKAVRFLLVDKLFMPTRKKVVYGGLTSYKECTDYIHRYHWYPTIREQWWPINPLAFENNQLPPDDPEVSVLKQRNRKLIAYVGRFVEEKGIGDLINAVAKLDDSYVLLLVGGGKDQASIEQLIIQNQLQNKIHLLGPKSPAALLRYLHMVDMLVLPSRTDYFWKEQYGRILAEAMATKTLVIGSNSGSIPYVINNKALIFPEKNIEQLQKVIQQAFNQALYQNQELLATNRKRALQADPQRFVEAFCQL